MKLLNISQKLNVCHLCLLVLITLVFNQSFAIDGRFNQLPLFSDGSHILARSFAQNDQGYLLLATDSGLLKYDAHHISSVDINIDESSIKKVFIDSNDILWLGTRGQGLLSYDGNRTTVYKYNGNGSINSDHISDIVEDDKKGLWVGTDKGLNYIQKDGKISSFQLTDQSGDSLFITALMVLDDSLLIGSKKGLFIYDIHTHLHQKLPFLNQKGSGHDDSDVIIYTLAKDSGNNIWVGTQKGLYKKAATADYYQSFDLRLNNFQILSLSVDGESIWVGTMSNGLFQYKNNGKRINSYRYNQNAKFSLTDDAILSLFLDQSGVLWIGTYYKGVNYIDTKSLRFGLQGGLENKAECIQNLLFSGFAEDQFNNLLFVNRQNLVQVRPDQSCKQYTLNNTSDIFKSVINSSQNQIWVASTAGLYQLDNGSGALLEIKRGTENLAIHFIVEYDVNTLLLATRSGLYWYEISDQKLSSVDVAQPEFDNIRIYDYAQDDKNNYYFATQIGVMKIIDRQLSLYSEVQSQLLTTEILSVFIDHLGYLWVGSEKNGLYKFDGFANLISHNSHFGESKSISIHSIIDDDQGHLWMGSNRGLIKMSMSNNDAHVFHQSDGLQADFFNVNAVYKANDGRLYFGGRNGFNAFYPQDITLNNKPPTIVITGFSRFGKSVDIGKQQEGFILPKAINDLDELLLSHKDYVIGFEFSALDFADSSRHRYAYKMEGLDPDWNIVNAKNRRISYSNLKSGDYIFKVKGANKDGVWNDVGKSLKIKVSPAPWLSWWAYGFYALSFLIACLWLFNRRIKANQVITDLLRVEVAEQTQKLQIQKKQVEELLARKNEFFANISHEFRTPLTLILGPIDQILRSRLPFKHMNALQMINRNANRLLTMIEQLLQLAKISNEEKVIFKNQQTQSVILAIVESFKSIAAEKKINLELVHNDAAIINCTEDALEITLGNLISNAIKYTPVGGEVLVSASVVDQRINIEVKDTGCGLDEDQKTIIFERFKRLNAHQNINGIGIGLSVVQEVLKINSASIDVISKLGEGSCFVISFTRVNSDCQPTVSDAQCFLLNQLAQEKVEIVTKEEKSSLHLSQRKESVLIIEDSHDMRTHIKDVLEDHYDCILAKNGKEGVSLAIKYVPDLIICDVMMPQMDGFHVCRIMRSDTRTSHIPLILLTALEDKKSRIRGWREHVDIYLTKPFNAKEMLLQLENVLVIRKILKVKAHQIVTGGKQLLNSDLPKKDQEFINKLNQLIAKKFQDSSFLRPQMAREMAISERQLQRKIKALIDKSPMDLLREHRLNEAAKMLKEGYRVNVTSDRCGFNSLPHFSKCFKTQFGMAPKVYQKSCQQ